MPIQILRNIIKRYSGINVKCTQNKKIHLENVLVRVYEDQILWIYVLLKTCY